MILVILG